MTTLLIEKYNEKKTGFIEYICSPAEENISLTDEEVWKLKAELTVNSMAEIVERFEPEVVVSLGTEQITIPICHKDGFFWQMIHLWETIRQGKYTVITKEDLEEALLVKDELEEAEWIKVQEQIFTYIRQNKIEKAKVQIKACEPLFSDGLFLTKMLITKAEAYFEKAEKRSRRFVAAAEEGMSLQCIAVSKPFQKSRYHSQRSEEIFRQLLGETIEKDTLIYWNLMLNCQSLSKEERQQLEAVLKEQKELYKKAKEHFLRQAAPMIQTLFTCYRYFKKPEAAPLLITNCTVEELAEESVLPALKRYLETVNEKLYKEDVIKNVMLPNITREQKKTALTRERFQAANKEYDREMTNDIASAEALQGIFHSFGIDTELFLEDEGEPFGYALTGIEVLGEVSGQEKELRELTIWLDRWKLYREDK